MKLELDIPADVFDAQFPEDGFRWRVRELAILELVRVKRIHEHEAAEMLGVGRWELVEKMKAAGFAPTEEVFAGIRGELERAIAARRQEAERAAAHGRKNGARHGGAKRKRVKRGGNGKRKR
jgi:hypothetical protein